MKNWKMMMAVLIIALMLCGMAAAVSVCGNGCWGKHPPISIRHPKPPVHPPNPPFQSKLKTIAGGETK